MVETSIRFSVFTKLYSLFQSVEAELTVCTCQIWIFQRYFSCPYREFSVVGAFAWSYLFLSKVYKVVFVDRRVDKNVSTNNNKMWSYKLATQIAITTRFELINCFSTAPRFVVIQYSMTKSGGVFCGFCLDHPFLDLLGHTELDWTLT